MISFHCIAGRGAASGVSINVKSRSAQCIKSRITAGRWRIQFLAPPLAECELWSENIAMDRPPIVYLDTQDFSRFGDVLRGKSDTATETLFLEVERRSKAGDAIFPASMPIIGELLQYNADYRDTTICKAQAVERLCGHWGLAFPSRLIAAELLTVARQRQLMPDGPPPEILSSDRYWYPNISGALNGLRSRLQGEVESAVSNLQLSNRYERRRAKRLVKHIDPSSAIRAAAPEFAANFGLPVETVINSVVALVRGRITATEASRRLFGEIAKPVTFVEAYFEKVEVDRSALPGWMRLFGDNFERRFLDLRTQTLPILDNEDGRAALEQLLTELPKTLGPSILGMADEDDLAEFGLTTSIVDSLRVIEGIENQVAASDIVGNVIPAYARQVLGLRGNPARVERSFGGDLVHALYLPHVDLWRGDRRFAEVVTQAVPHYAPKIVPRLAALPAAIDAWLRAAD